MSISVFNAFPTRPMRLHKSGVGQPLLFFIGILMGLGIMAMVVHSNAPGILRDWEIAKDPVALNQARVSNGKCTTRQFVFTDCSVAVSYMAGGHARRQELEFAFFDIHSGSYTVSVVASQSKPELVTVDLALDKLWNRIIAACFLALVGLAFVAGGLWAMAKQMNMRRAFRAFNGKVLRAVPVEVLSLTKNYGMRTATYQFDANGKQRKLSTALRRQMPLYLDEDANSNLALGVTDAHGDYVLLLDEALERLDFTDAERQALRNARTANAVQKPQGQAFPAALAGIEPAR